MERTLGCPFGKKGSLFHCSLFYSQVSITKLYKANIPPLFLLDPKLQCIYGMFYNE